MSQVSFDVVGALSNDLSLISDTCIMKYFYPQEDTQIAFLVLNICRNIP